MTQLQKNTKRQKLPKSGTVHKKQVFTKLKKKMEKEIFAFCVITFEPIKLQTCSAPQNDRLNFSFMKDIYVVGEKMASKGRKMDLSVANLMHHPLRLLSVNLRLNFVS